jgi:hypothetical protein
VHADPCFAVDCTTTEMQETLCQKDDSHLHGFADASALDDEVVKAACFGQPAYFLNQVLPKRAADASILHAFIVGLSVRPVNHSTAYPKFPV